MPLSSATVVITTKNRKEDLRGALLSCLQQTAPIEIVVIDDGSTDGTADMVGREFPTVRLHREECSRGLIVRRNEGAKIAEGTIIVSIDDDAAFSDRHVIEQTLADFDHPRIGAVAIPFVNVKQGERVFQTAPDAIGRFVVDSYIGTAHAVRRDVFLALGGYSEHFVHQGEEGDFCIRLLEAGYVVRLGRSSPIHHFESPRRDFRRMDYFGRRNDILFAWQNVPLANLPVHLAATTVQGAAFGIRLGRPMRMLLGIAAGYASCIGKFSRRSPVLQRTYRLYRSLKKDGPRHLRDIEAALQPMRPPVVKVSPGHKLADQSDDDAPDQN